MGETKRKITMTEFHQVTTDMLYFRDPAIDPPPRAVSLLLLNPGGVLIVGNWTDDCIGWCPKPKIPRSLKDKMTGEKTWT
jgi:hypothetical protein